MQFTKKIFFAPDNFKMNQNGLKWILEITLKSVTFCQQDQPKASLKYLGTSCYITGSWDQETKLFSEIPLVNLANSQTSLKI